MNGPKQRVQSMTQKADAAFERASRKVIERAQQTNTPIVIWKDGRVQHIPVAQISASSVEPPSVNES